MTTREQEPNLHERVVRLETGIEAVIRTLGEIRRDMKDGFAQIREEIGGIRRDMKDGFARVDMRFLHMESRLDSWLKWVLGFILSSWLTTIASIWLKR